MSELASPAGPSLHALVRRGAVWSMLAYGGSHVLRFGGNLVLTRLLFPEAFGLMALVNGLLQGLQLFSDFGVGPSIIQSARGDDPRFLNTAWTLQAIRGVCLWIVACAIALPFARFYGDPALAWILPLAGLAALIAGFHSTRLFSLQRHVDLARVSVIEVGSYAIGLVVMMVWAAIDHSIAALVAGGIASSLAKLVLSHTALPGIPNRFQWDRTSLSSLLLFGRWIFFSTILTFLVGQSDRLVFGKLVPIAMLGVYNVGAMIATMPETALARLAQTVFFPAYSRVQNSSRDLSAVFARARKPLLVVAGASIAGSPAPAPRACASCTTRATPRPGGSCRSWPSAAGSPCWRRRTARGSSRAGRRSGSPRAAPGSSRACSS
jgi:O-antigen/teichoic acid export membrane protein